MLLLILSVGLALCISALCSLVEATLLSLTPSQVAGLSQKYPRVGTIWQRFKANIQAPIATILLLNTTAHTIGASVAGAQFSALYGDGYILVFSLVFTFVMLQFTEILPKTMGVRYNREVARFTAQPLLVLTWIFKPILGAVHWLNRPFERRPKEDEVPATVEEIAALAGLARLSQQISYHQERIIQGASHLSHLNVQEVMIPVDQVCFLDANKSISEAVLTAHGEAHTRFPVIYDGNPDKVVGYVNFKEMVYSMRTNPNDPSLRGIIRPVRFVLPGTTAAELMTSFVTEHIHIAIIRDGSGKTLGMVTLEDIVEELVGDIEDEFDRLPRMVHTLANGTWMFGGGTPLAEVADHIKQDFPTKAGTLSAWLLHRFDRVPRSGDRYTFGNYDFIVRRVRRGKVFEVSIVRRDNNAPGGGSPAPGSHTG